MSEKSKDLGAVLEAVKRPPERSTLFWWLVKHHDDLVAAADGNRMRWTPLCARFAALGLTDTAGRPPTLRGARETWLQARAYVAKRRAAKPKDRPSRLPATTRPPVEAPRAPVAPRTSAPAPPAPIPAVPREMNDAARAMLASLQEQLDYADRYVRPQKRKG